MILEPSKKLYNEVRAGFIKQGTTFNKIAIQEGLDPNNVKSALIGSWDGPKARKVRKRFCKMAGIIKDDTPIGQIQNQIS